MTLTTQQIAFFNHFGYLGVPGFFTPEEIAWITEEFEWAINNHGGGRNHDGSRRTMFGGPIEHRARACTILDMPKVKGLIGGVIGDDFSYTGGDGNYYTGDTGWHPDGNWGRLFAVKVAFYLDPLTRDTGALRVIPGSQRPDHLLRKEKIDPNGSMELFGVHPREFPGNVALETSPGDIVMFNHDTYHASFGGKSRRRMFTMNCVMNAKTHEDIAIARQYIATHSAGGYNVETGAGAFLPAMLQTADASRMVHLRQVAELHDDLYPHLAPSNVGKVKVLRREVSALVPDNGDIAKASPPPAGLAFQEAQPQHYGLIDIRAAHGGKQGTVFVRTAFTLRDSGPVSVVYSADGPVKVWLNGKPIDCRPDATNPNTPAKFHVTHDAHAGENEALFAISTNQGKACGVIPTFVAV